MAFWTALLFGVIVACYCGRAGLYQSWVTMFNFLVSMYLAIFAGPWICGYVPALGTEWMTRVVVMAVVAAGVFVVLHLLSYVYFLEHYKVTFPKIFDLIASGFLGLGGGFLMFSFIIFLLLLTPMRNSSLADLAGLDAEGAKQNIAAVVAGCNLIDRFAVKDSEQRSAEEVIGDMIASMDEKPTDANGLAVIEGGDPNAIEVGAGDLDGNEPNLGD